MKKFMFIGLPIFLVVCYGFLPNMNNQRELIKKIEKNLEKAGFYTEKIDKNKATTPNLQNQLIHTVFQRDKAIDSVADTLSLFLQRYIKIEDEDLDKKLISVHKMLNLCFRIKQDINICLIDQFFQELNCFKKLIKCKHRRTSRFNKYRRIKNN